LKQGVNEICFWHSLISQNQVKKEVMTVKFGKSGDQKNLKKNFSLVVILTQSRFTFGTRKKNQ
jgi:hypothetical protein